MKPYALLLLVAFAACTPSNVIEVKCDGSRVRVEAVNDTTMRVRSVPRGGKFPKSRSLCVVPQGGVVPPCVKSSGGGETILSTSRLVAKVSLQSGAVSFTDAEGRALASEHSRHFTPISDGGVNAYTVLQTFDSPDDEAFYGLGQHQAGEWNYKGKNEELYQYNTKISVAFVVSTRGYGILWDSYCFCRWGDPREYASLDEVFDLFDKDGVPGALTGIYTPSEGAPLVRRETSLSQEYLRTPQCDVVKNSPSGFKFGGSFVTFEGTLQPRESGVHRFYLYYAGYTKVFIDGREVVPEIWRTAWNPNGCKFQLDMEPGKRYPIRVEWQPDGDVSYDALKVLSPTSEESQNRMSWWGEMQECIDYYIIASSDMEGVISGYRTLTGASPIPPKWAFGYWQSRERYRTRDEILSTLSRFRQSHIPIDNIVQDWQYWLDDQWGSHEFDPGRFPDPKGMVDSIHAQDARYMISVWPKFYENTGHFKEFDAKGWMYRVPVDSNVVDWLGYRQSFYDAYSEGARALFWNQMKDHLLPLGVDSWWMDASEPNIHDCTDLEFRKAMSGPTALGPASQYLNAYALMNAQAIWEGQRAEDPSRRVFLLTRNGFAGLQRYGAASWSGDIGTTWGDMKTQISAGLNYSMSGIPMWGQDVGGFSVQNKFAAAMSEYQQTRKVSRDLLEWRELQLRWHQWGAFTPLYRSHGQWPFREPWEIAPEGDPCCDGIVEAIKLRYRLLPYIYSCASRIHFDGSSLMRPLVMDFTGDLTAREVSDQFLCGPSIMVCPVCEYLARSREVYLPQGCGWYSFRDGTRHEGGQTITAPAPLGSIPVFVRSGSIVPLGPVVQSTATPQTNITLMIYPGSDAVFTLYDDDGVSYDYEQGAFCRVSLRWDDASGTLFIGAREGAFEGMQEKLHFLVINCATKEEGVIEYDGRPVSLTI